MQPTLFQQPVFAILVVALLGAAIGAEREWRRR
jgi:uncharacterized membrane protein YhiD involved in acid resistance